MGAFSIREIQDNDHHRHLRCIFVVGKEVISHNGHCMLPDGPPPRRRSFRYDFLVHFFLLTFGFHILFHLILKCFFFIHLMGGKFICLCLHSAFPAHWKLPYWRFLPPCNKRQHIFALNSNFEMHMHSAHMAFYHFVNNIITHTHIREDEMS